MPIENPPPAPDDIAQYIIDGLQRQDTESLKQIEKYAKELRETIIERDSEPIPDEDLESR